MGGPFLRPRGIGDTVAAKMADMMFDLVCQHCGRREQRRWESRKSVTVTYCTFCMHGMSVVGIAFFAPQAEQAAA
ncbi:MAG TPA: hypothetical protein VN973_01745 [Candidatus Dormibacteraeota bacterium]|nr:hypothetical protein [Candidatus Dormibacteraeota bacterium]